ncbi:MAG: NAD(+)/NADH kinase [Lachnospiraceae bacterium]|jgi:NAD+ kinase|nr:NAD(+)/NADH kinase [Lachnospiraceae bacterium]
MNHFYIITNGHKDYNLEKTNEIRKYLEKCGKKCTVQVKEPGKEQGYTDAAQIPEDVDCILVLGGDGTLLQAARDIMERDIPLLGINLGTLGYLAEIEESGIYGALNQLLEGGYEVEQRMMLAGRIVRGEIHRKRHAENGYQQDETEKSYALNDIAITRSGSLQIIRFRICVNGQFLNEYQADGVIVATPTGSTGYNLSAGGPIVEPKAELILITPISPHTLNTRSIILAPGDVVEIEIGGGREGRVQQVEVNFDGSHNVTLYTGDKVIIERAVRATGIVKLNKASFLEVLHKKLSV